MLELLIKIFNLPICTHPNVETTKAISYCPDCGKLIRTNWYIIRCSCCGKKRIGILRGNTFFPIAKFCTNCGTKEYEVEKIENLNYFDMNFAIAKKEEENIPKEKELLQSWCEEVEMLEKLSLLPHNLN